MTVATLHLPVAVPPLLKENPRLDQLASLAQSKFNEIFDSWEALRTAMDGFDEPDRPERPEQKAACGEHAVYGGEELLIMLH